MTLTARKRQELYDREAAKAKASGRGEYPLCNLCGLPVSPGQQWDESHDPGRPRAFGGTDTAIAHRRCNRDHGARFVTPMVAKANRQRFAHTGAKLKSRRPLPGGKSDAIKKKMDGSVIDRRTGAPWRGWR